MNDFPPLEHRGCRLVYHVRGDGPPVLLIQGVAVHGDGWGPQVDGLADRFACMSFDNRGMGQSQPLGGPLTVEQMAEDALALMDARGWPSAHVVGHLLGGLVALHVALTARRRVRSLALLCTFADGRVPTRLTPWMMWVGLRTRVGPRRARRRAFLRLIVPPGELAALSAADQDALAESMAPLFGHDLADQPPVVMKQLAAMKAYDATPRLAELAGVPTVVASGAHDRIAPPAAGRALAAGIPRARYVEWPDASHGVTIRDAGRVNALLAGHFEQAEAGRDGEAEAASAGRESRNVC